MEKSSFDDFDIMPKALALALAAIFGNSMLFGAIGLKQRHSLNPNAKPRTQILFILIKRIRLAYNQELLLILLGNYLFLGISWPKCGALDPKSMAPAKLGPLPSLNP
jgi:hypothetical protein